MKEILYLEIPTPDADAVLLWLHQDFQPGASSKKTIAPDGIRLRVGSIANTSGAAENSSPDPATSLSSNSQSLSPCDELSLFVWSLQRTTYLKVFRWAAKPLAGEKQILAGLSAALRKQFPYNYPEPPAFISGERSIFEVLAPYYPLTVEYFQKIPNGEYDLNRVYWWEKRWREGVRNPQQPERVIFKTSPGQTPEKSEIPNYDIIYIGGALGVVHAAVMARLGYRVLLIERLPFGRMNREWNISREEFQSLIDLGLFDKAEFESIIACEYADGFSKFFDINNPPQCKAPVLHTPTVLNVALDAEKLLRLCGKKLLAAGGEIWDETEFIRADIEPDRVMVQARHLPSESIKNCSGRLLVDAMGTASPIAWQLNGTRTFDSVCPTVGALLSGLEPGVWDKQYGDVLNSHGDISRGRQLIWELFPGKAEEMAIYLFHYHEVNPDNPGSLLEMYEDFFTILPEYRRCDLDKLVWKKATFGYIPGHFSIGSRDRSVAFDRLIAMGDAASLQSPLVFTGFGSLVRNLPRLTHLLDIALKHDLLAARHLNQIRAYQSNIAVTWLFSKGMMVPSGRFLQPERINSMLNTFFGILASEPLPVANAFIKDRVDWFTFNRLALKAAWINPALLLWIWELAGAKDMLRWLGSYFSFTFYSFIGWLFAWLPSFTRWCQPWAENRWPALWFWLLAQSYALTYGLGSPQKIAISRIPQERSQPLKVSARVSSPKNSISQNS